MDLSRIHLLPRDILVEILLELPFQDIMKLCNLYSRVNSLCQDEYFWARKVEREFGLSRDLFLSLDQNRYPPNRPSLRYLNFKYFYHLRPSLFLSRAAELGSIPLIDYILHHYSFNPRTLSDIFIKMLFRVGQNRKLLAIFSIILKSTEFELIFAICSPLYLFYFLIEISFPISRNMLWNEIFFLRETSKKWNSSSKSTK